MGNVIPKLLDVMLIGNIMNNYLFQIETSKPQIKSLYSSDISGHIALNVR